MDDITAFIKTCLPSAAPLFLMGHSMGGQEVLVYIHDGPADVKRHIRGYLTESPFIAFDKASKPSPFTVVMGRLVGKLLPHRQMVFKIDPKLLSHDVATQKEFADDPLCHDTGSVFHHQPEYELLTSDRYS
jgi:acylglycerol lipase